MARHVSENYPQDVQQDMYDQLLRKMDELVADPTGSREKADRIIETLGAPCPDCSDYAKFSHDPS